LAVFVSRLRLIAPVFPLAESPSKDQRDSLSACKDALEFKALIGKDTLFDVLHFALTRRALQSFKLPKSRGCAFFLSPPSLVDPLRLPVLIATDVRACPEPRGGDRAVLFSRPLARPWRGGAAVICLVRDGEVRSSFLPSTSFLLLCLPVFLATFRSITETLSHILPLQRSGGKWETGFKAPSIMPALPSLPSPPPDTRSLPGLDTEPSPLLLLPFR
ncbi:MAG: hypothetical protein OK454_03820, partial [Thaumarchaeota archaeon]|nr:hypothetical protein [Nitrososphaerota archaeon]